MKTKITLLKSLFLVLCCTMLSRVGLAQTVQFLLTNDAQVSPTEYEFDLYIKSGSGTFELAGHQYNITYNTAMKNGGTMTGAWVGTVPTQLTNVSQRQNTFNLATNGQIRLAAPPAPGCGNGSIISDVPGVKVGRVRLTNSVPFAQVQANLAFGPVTVNPRTSANLYVDAPACVVGNKAFCVPGVTIAGCVGTTVYLPNILTNPVLNAPTCVTPVFNAVPTSPTCQGGNDGSIDVTVTAGSPAPFSYSWSNGALIEDLSGLSAGSYTVTVTTNTGGCSASQIVVVNDGAPSVTYYADGDNDGYGNALVSQASCTGAPIGFVANSTDCNDADNTVNPGVLSDGCNGVDNDCDGLTDEDAVFQNYYADGDGDGYGTGAATSSCSPIPGSVTLSGDCNDVDNTVNPGVLSDGCNGVDNDCDGLTDEDAVFQNYYADGDGDGYGTGAATSSCSPIPGSVTLSGDCNDVDNTVNPGVLSDGCNGVDNDCDGLTDEDAVFQNYYADGDGDGYGAGAATSSCSPIPGSVTLSGDCNDVDNTVNPGVLSDGCNGVDNDCDGLTDEDAVFQNYYADGDGDGYGAGAATSSCTPIPGSVTLSGDCNDADNTVNPGVLSDGCNGVDNDCDGLTDEDAVFQNYYADGDGDGYGAGAATSSCTPIPGSVTLSGDCNDADNTVNPGVLSDGCNNVDNDCDGLTDEDAVFVTYYADVDVDGFGDFNTAGVASCTPIPGTVTNNGDCNDNNNAINPNATEICNGVDDDCDGTADDGLTFVNYYVDGDNDGYGAGAATSSCNPIPGSVTVAGDCNDNDNTVNPGVVVDGCNGVDNDCDGLTDEDATFQNYYVDGDNDGYGAGAATSSCTPIPGSATVAGDCNDNDNTVNPGVVSDGCNGVDNDCDGLTDEDATFQNYYVDGDGDGYGAGAATSSCSPIPGSVTVDGDCNDSNNNINPGAAEVCNAIDDNCNGLTDDGLTFVTYFADGDGDTYGNPANSVSTCNGAPVGYVADNTDCNDANSAVNPGATEVCNNVDDDCDGLTDEGLTFADYYADLDGDTYGGAFLGNLCAQPVGSVTVGGDCNDGNNTVNPGATEACNNIDDDCDGLTDEGLTFLTYYVDGDGDGFGAGAGTLSCTAIFGSVTNNGDCNDASNSIFPGAPEQCNGVDDDCNGLTDDGVTVSTWYQDADGDSYGNAAVSLSNCAQPVGYVLNSTDCNDNNGAVNPGATEVCNSIDDDCDGLTDEGVLSTFYADVDGDNYGDASSSVQGCSAPVGYVADNTDCNDAVGSINPGAAEACNNIDDDCDGLTDEGLTFSTYFADGDGDGYGAGAPIVACAQPANTSINNTDCNDANGAVNPGATEVCNSIDDDCDGFTDEGVTSTFYADTDGDSYGDASSSVQGCSAPVGYVADNTDCNDANGAVNPGATEVCNSIDDDCDGLTDEGVTSTFYADADGDNYGDASSSVQGCSAPVGYVADNTDCNDAVGTINPGATEVCNNIDDDCDGLTDEGLPSFTYYADGDGDTYGNAASSIVTCNGTTPVGYVLNSLDCDDNNNAVNPGVSEVCGNMIDDNCDGNTDEGCGCSNPPTANAGASSTICAGADVSLNGSIGGGATSGTWSTSGDGTFNPSNLVLNATYTPGPLDISNGTVTLTLTTDAVTPCVPAVDNRVITIQALPASPGAISGPAGLCNPFNTTTTYSIAPVAGATSYTWTVPAGTTLLSGQGTTSITVTWPFSNIHNGVVGQICVTANNSNSCGSGTPSCLGISVQLTTPVTPPSISGAAKACPGETGVIYSVALVARADNYVWTVPAGATITSGQNTNVITVSYGPSFTGGPISVVASNACGSSPARTRNISLNILPASAAISGQATGVCSSVGVVYSATPVVGALSYLWNVPAGATIMNGQGSASITVDFSGSYAGGSITVIAQNGCGNGSARALTVTGAPGQASPISGPVALCANQSYLFSVSTIAGAGTYTWTVPTGFSVTAGQGTKDATIKAGANPASGLSISVRASNSCGTGPIRSLNGISITLCPRIGESAAMNLSAYPNPVSDLLNVTFNNNQNEDVLVTMMDAAGRVVLNENRNAVEGANKFEFSVKGMAAGIYTMQIRTTGSVEKLRIIVE